jgi:hypothetical protein
MSMHTPGEWTARQQKNSRTGKNMGWIIEAENGSRIGWSDYADATTNKGDQPPYEQSGENANLIAAAPDLLEVLKKITDDFSYLWPLEHVEMAKAAIAKAEGSDTNA